MANVDELIDFEKYKVKPGQSVNLSDFDTEYKGNDVDKKESEVLLKESIEKLSEIQDKLYAHNRYSVLIIFQAMDAAGKDSAIKHVMTGFNPQGVKVHSFKVPSAAELDHNYLWRHYKVLPNRGEICIFNRSHYENVLVTRVHPEYVMGENLPGIDSLSKITQAFWESRFQQINRFEQNLVENGTVILKFFLNVSKKEQKKRFMQRIDDPSKNWKFSIDDVKERGHWDEYQHAYQEAIQATSTKDAPWFVVPADNKWFTRLVIARTIYNQFENLNIHYPVLDDKQRAKLQEAKQQLMNES